MKVSSEPETTEQKVKRDKRAPYEAPAVIYEGKITTRAGTGPLGWPDGGHGIDPADLFGD